MEPPAIVRYRTKKPRLTNNERREINEYGLKIPSKNVKNYEPDLNSTAALLNSGILAGSNKFNYKVKAKTNRNNSQRLYLQARANAQAKANNKTKKRPRNNNTNTNPNGTKRALFGI
jgi:hypothetical protein